MSIAPHPLITRLRVKNYRSLADIDTSLEPMTVFVGQNGSGKSTIIDVLRFVRDAVSKGFDAAILDRGGMSSIRRWSAKGRPYDITIQINLRYTDNITAVAAQNKRPGWSAEYSFTLGSESRGEFRVKWERLEVGIGSDNPQVLEARDGELIDFPVDLPENLEKIAPFYKRLVMPGRNLGLPFLASLAALQDETATRGTAAPILRNSVFDLLRSAGFYTIYPDVLREPQRPSNAYPLDERGQNLATVLRELKRNKTDFADTLREALTRVVEGVHDYSVKQVGGYLVTSLHHTILEGGRQGPAFDLAQESDGTLRILGILTALYQEPALPIITIEEPELTIHPGALGVLCDVLIEASTRSQILVTTHNSDLIDHFPVETLRVVDKVGGITQIGPVSLNQRRAIAEKLFSPGDLMRMEGLRSDRRAPLVES